MNNLWLNIRFLWFHLQAERGRLLPAWRRNAFWKDGARWLRSPVAFYDFSPRQGWSERNSRKHIAQAKKGERTQSREGGGGTSQ